MNSGPRCRPPGSIRAADGRGPPARSSTHLYRFLTRLRVILKSSCSPKASARPCPITSQRDFVGCDCPPPAEREGAEITRRPRRRISGCLRAVSSWTGGGWRRMDRAVARWRVEIYPSCVGARCHPPYTISRISLISPISPTKKIVPCYPAGDVLLPAARRLW